LGVKEDLSNASIRFGLGRFNTEEEVDYTIERVTQEVKRLRATSPLYNMARGYYSKKLDPRSKVEERTL